MAVVFSDDIVLAPRGFGEYEIATLDDDGYYSIDYFEYTPYTTIHRSRDNHSRGHKRLAARCSWFDGVVFDIRGVGRVSFRWLQLRGARNSDLKSHGLHVFRGPMTIDQIRQYDNGFGGVREFPDYMGHSPVKIPENAVLVQLTRPVRHFAAEYVIFEKEDGSAMTDEEVNAAVKWWLK